MTTCPYGYRIVGDCSAPRRLVDAAEALAAHAACDPRAELNRECYLSAFTFPDEFRRHLDATGSTRGYAGACWSPFVWWDIDRPDDLDRAGHDARRLAVALAERFAPSDEDLLIFFSGSKGYHVGLPTCLWLPEPSATFHRTGRRFAVDIAAAAGVVTDAGIYDRVRAFRAPNSRHPRTGRHKRRLSFDELMGLSTDAVLRLAESPEPFDVPEPIGRSEAAAAAWAAAAAAVERAAAEHARRRAERGETPRLNRLTLDLIRDGAAVAEGDRHRTLFSAAANLAEFGCPPALAHALLTDSGLDSGLPRGELARIIYCGLAHAGPPAPPPEGGSIALPPEPAPPATDVPPTALDRDADAPTPPPGAALFCQDGRARPCAADRARKWTWAGASRWFSVAEHPIPATAREEVSP